MVEIWLPIIGYEEIYEVSNYGILRSLDRIVKYKNGKKCFHKGRIIKQSKDEDGYYIVSLCKNGDQITQKIARLVAIHFIPNLENKPEVNHKDGIKTNNRVNNLEWSTEKENSQHAHDLGLCPLQKREQNNNSKLTEQNIPKIFEMLKMGMTQKEIGNILGVTGSLIGCVKRKEIWQ